MNGTEASPAPLTEPIPIVASRSWADLGATLSVRNFRLVIASMFTGSVGGWMSRVAQDWILLELTDNVAMVGLAITFQFAPILLFGLWGGVISDRFPRRRIVVIAQCVSTCLLVTLGILALTSTIQAWHIYLIAVVSGFAAIAEGPARTALVAQIVPLRNLQTAIGINAMMFHTAGLIGPTVAGLLIALMDSGVALIAAAALAVVSLASMLGIRTSELRPVASAPRGAGALDGLRYARRKPSIHWPLIVLAAVAGFGMSHTVLFAAAARDEGYGTGVAGFGLYLALGSAGALIGAALSLRRGTVRTRTVVFLAIGFGVAMLAAAIAPSEIYFLCAVVVFSGLRLLFVTAVESIVQLSANAGIRGRVAALQFVVVTGAQAGGAVLIGWISQEFGVGIAFAVGGGVPLIVALTVAMLIARQRELGVAIRGRRLRIIPRHRPAASLS